MGETGVDIGTDELAAAVGVTEEEADNGENRTEDLCRNMPSGLGDL